MTQNRRSIVVGLIGVIGGTLLGLGAGYQLWAGGAGETQRIPIEGSEKALIEESPSSVLTAWLPARRRTQIRIAGQEVGELEDTNAAVSIDRYIEDKKMIWAIRVMAPASQRVLTAKFYPENGAIKQIRTRTPDGDFIGTAKFRKDGTVKSLQRYKSNTESTLWKFDREGNITMETPVKGISVDE